MKPLVWAALLFCGVAGAAPECAHTSREHYVSGWEETASVELIQQRITPQGVVSCVFLPDREQRLNVLARYEQGTLNGVGYKLNYTDGSAVIQGSSDIPLPLEGQAGNWRLVCKTAGGDLLYRCTLGKGDIRLLKDTDGGQSLEIGENHRADSQLLLRVDGNWAVTAPASAGFSTDQVSQLLGQMRSGKKADTSYHSADLQGLSWKTMTLYGFPEALEIMDNVLAQLKTPPAVTQ